MKNRKVFTVMVSLVFLFAFLEPLQRARLKRSHREEKSVSPVRPRVRRSVLWIEMAIAPAVLSNLLK